MSGEGAAPTDPVNRMAATRRPARPLQNGCRGWEAAVAWIPPFFRGSTRLTPIVLGTLPPWTMVLDARFLWGDTVTAAPSAQKKCVVDMKRGDIKIANS